MKKSLFYHNPRCRKSRETLQIVSEKNIDYEVVEYLNDPPSASQISFILAGLKMHPLDLIRTQEKVFKELGLSKKDSRSDAEWIDIMVNHPILIERPIFIYKEKVALGRPPENVLEIIP